MVRVELVDLYSQVELHRDRKTGQSACCTCAGVEKLIDGRADDACTGALYAFPVSLLLLI